MLQSCQWNQVKHLPVKLVRAPRHVFNMLRVEVLCYPREHGFVETEYASICFHLHELASHSFLRGDAPSPPLVPSLAPSLTANTHVTSIRGCVQETLICIQT